MSKIVGVREQRVQYYYDTDFATAGAQGAATNAADVATSTKTLFLNANNGNLVRSNMPSPGFLSGDQTFLCWAVRHEINLYGGASPTAPSGSANPAGFRDTASVMVQTLNLSTFRLSIGDKPMFEGPVTMTPAGGGPWGFVSDSAQPIVTNGQPQQKAIYVLPIPIPIAKRQAIKMEEFKGTYNGTVTVTLTDLINGYTGSKIFRAYIDGFNTRDVQ